MAPCLATLALLHLGVLGLLLFAGCLSLGDSIEPGSGETGAESEEDILSSNETWSHEIDLTPTFPNTGFGVPFAYASYQLGGACDIAVKLSVPENATRLETKLTGEPASPGAGYMVHKVFGVQSHYPGSVEETEGRPIYADPPDTAHEIIVEDPSAAEYWVDVYPHGPVAAQQWDLTVTIEGVGEQGDVQLDSLGGRDLCSEPVNPSSPLDAGTLNR